MPIKHKLKDRGHDLYETPEVATWALIEHENLYYKKVWEPACGKGAISEVLYQAGCSVISTDLVDYGYGESRVDFLMTPLAAQTNRHIITNPPYKLASDFARHAMALNSPYVALLLRLSFLESEGRSDILDDGRLSRVLVFKKRLPMMHRDGWDGPKASSSVAHAWFIWDKRHKGPTEVHRV